MNTVKEIAFAKVNLFLDIQSRRDDGFHDILTLMQPITLFDEIQVSMRPSSDRYIEMQVYGGAHVPVDERNLAYRAANLYMEYLGVNAHIILQLKKQIPVAAGLAGGSADAAATLRAMNRLFKKALTKSVLLKIALSLGSDVPFCFLQQSAICEGRGEIMHPVASGRTLFMVVAIADEFVSTPMAYAALDEMYANFDGSVPYGRRDALTDITSYICGEGESVPSLYNIFENAVLPMCKGAAAIREKMQNLGALACAMSGSGPSMFGIFESEKAAMDARDALRECGYRAFYVTNKIQ